MHHSMGKLVVRMVPECCAVMSSITAEVSPVTLRAYEESEVGVLLAGAG